MEVEGRRPGKKLNFTEGKKKVVGGSRKKVELEKHNNLRRVDPLM